MILFLFICHVSPQYHISIRISTSTPYTPSFHLLCCTCAMPLAHMLTTRLSIYLYLCTCVHTCAMPLAHNDSTSSPLPFTTRARSPPSPSSTPTSCTCNILRPLSDAILSNSECSSIGSSPPVTITRLSPPSTSDTLRNPRQQINAATFLPSRKPQTSYSRAGGRRTREVDIVGLEGYTPLAAAWRSLQSHTRHC